MKLGLPMKIYLKSIKNLINYNLTVDYAFTFDTIRPIVPIAITTALRTLTKII